MRIGELRRSGRFFRIKRAGPTRTRLITSARVALIQIENITHTYGARRGIEEVSLTVSEGALFGFLGPNGAGKTTLIRVMLGFLRATSGAAKIFGRDCWGESK